MELKLEGVVPHYSKNKYYLFGNSHYGRYKPKIGLDKNYPRHVSEAWRDLWERFPGPYDAILVKSDYKAYYFFKGNKYVRYQVGKGIYKSDYPYNIANHWRGLTNQLAPPYDAVFYRPIKGKYYFFKGDQYSRYTPGDGPDDGYPKSINKEWRDLWERFPGPYDAVCAHITDPKITYFFKGGSYVRYKHGTGLDDAVANGKWAYPQSTDYRWKGAWTLKQYSAFTLGEFLPAGPTFSIRTLQNSHLALVPSGQFRLKLLATTNNTHLPGVTRQYCIEGMTAGSVQDFELHSGADKLLEFKARHAPLPSQQTPFTFAMGSCLNDAENKIDSVPTIEAMLQDQPEFMLWNGDTSYYIGDGSTGEGTVKDNDMKDQRRMFLRMFTTRHQPSVVKAVHNIPAISTWDDHDFGFNNSNKDNMSNSEIKLATEVFKTCWPNNYNNLTNYNSIEHSFRYGATEVFCPDTRTHRSPSRKVILGKIQAELLIAKMQKSNAALKILVLSSQLIPKKTEGEGFYNCAKKERKKLLEQLADESISGRVLILSGDVHYSELSFYDEGNGRPKIIELTSSPTLKKNRSFSSPHSSAEKQRVWGAKGNTYALLHVTYVRNKPVVAMHIKDEFGNTAEIHASSGGRGAGWGQAAARWTDDNRITEIL